MIAISGALLEENDIDGRLIPHQFSIPSDFFFTDMEIHRVGVFSAVCLLSFLSYSHRSNLSILTHIMELTSMRLLLRMPPIDRLDGPPMRFLMMQL
jgi:origin recognition complex subunit 5